MTKTNNVVDSNEARISRMNADDVIDKLQSAMNPQMADIKYEVCLKNTLRKVSYNGNEYALFENYVNHGIMCVFDMNGEYYTADFCFVDDKLLFEIMIFKSDEYGRIDDWDDLYVREFIEDDFNDTTMVKCIDEFINDNK